ncbi:MAG: Methionine transporter ATP-binding protein [Actinomycetia bacterium]|nr:Methionine transporter ATP-binding protein [Actinomycetes bacterium]
MRAVRRLLLVVAAALLWAAPAQAFSKQTGMRTMSDGTSIAYDLYEPDGTAPAGGWPGVIAMHGLGGSKDDMAAVAEVFASHGYAVLAYTDRGHGTSGGVAGLAGPDDIGTEQAVFSFFAGLPEVSDTQIGAWGISYGGGQTWNGLAAGIPYKAAEVVESWTDLYSALFPQNLAKSGIVLGFAKAIDARSPLIAASEDDAIHSTNMGALKILADSRSSYAKLPSIKTPVYMFQGRVDYAFDVGQALNGYMRITGPKHLYVGQFGHTPSTFPGPDKDYVFAQGLAWYDHYLKGAPNGIDTAPPVTIAAATGSKRTSYTGLPKTKVIPAGFRGTSTHRTGPVFQQALETFGVSLLKVQVQKVSNYPRLVATVLAGNRVITHGGIVPKVGLNTIRLADYVQYLPTGTRLTVTFGDSSTKDVAYLGFGSAGSISLGPAELSLQILTKPVSG